LNKNRQAFLNKPENGREFAASMSFFIINESDFFQLDVDQLSF